jgi:hypothetical protein
MEDTHSTGSDKKADNDQDDAPKELLADNGENATDDKDRRKDPQNCCHDKAPFKASLTP